MRVQKQLTIRTRACSIIGGVRAENREIKKFYKSFIVVIFEFTNSYYIVDRKKGADLK